MIYEREGKGVGRVIDTDHISGLGNLGDDCVKNTGVDMEGEEVEFSPPIILQVPKRHPNKAIQ